MKRKNVVGTIAAVVVVALMAAGLSACSSDDAKASSSKSVTVRGWAYAGAPLEHATLTISTPDGKTVVRTGGKATNSNGTFRQPAQVPASYRVALDGGTLGDEVFTGHLVADVTGPSTEPIQVNQLTTLLAAYRDRHPDLSPARDQVVVRRFLALPDGIDVTADLRGLDDSFSPAEFQRQAQAAGGIQRFVKQLVAEMDARPARTHAFVGAAQNDITTDGIKAAAKALAKYGLKTALEQVGLGPPEKAVVDMINRVSAQVAALQTSVDQIKDLVNQEIFNTAVAPALAARTIVVDAFRNLKFGADNDDPDSTARAMRQINQIADGAYLTTVNQSLMGAANTTGAYVALSNSLKSGSFWTPAKSKTLLDFFDYFDAVQAQMILLLAQLVHGTPSESKFDLPNGNLDLYIQQRAVQQALRPAAAPTVIDTRTNLMWPISIGNRPDTQWWGQLSDLSTLNHCTLVITGIQISCGTSSLYGFTNWRLPEASELKDLMAGQKNPRAWLQLPTNWGPTAFVRTAPLTNVVNVWSGTHDPDPRNAWHSLTNLDTGAQTFRPDSTLATIWPVRGLTPTEKYWL